MLFDSHSHLNNEEFSEEERASRIAEIDEDPQLSYVMDIGFDLDSSRMAADHAARYSWCYAAVGIHPHNAEGSLDAVDALRRLAGQEGVQAIGEIGLDFHYDISPRESQREMFRRQIRLALELSMPMAIHSREADQETMDILQEEGAFSQERKGKFPDRPVPTGWEQAAGDARVLLHCFSGSSQLGERYVRMGGTLSIAGPVTFKNNRKTVQVVEEIPSEFLLAETDAPFLTPVPHRGTPNRSCYVEHTVRRMALIRGMDYEEMARITCENARRFYNIVSEKTGMPDD